MKKQHTSSSHEFAFFVPDLSVDIKQMQIGDAYISSDAELITRIISVVRLKPEESCILFDRSKHAHATLKNAHKKNITFHINSIQKNQSIKPELICLLPVLKKDDLSQAVSMITACGVTHIQLVMTAKVQRAWGGNQEMERLERVMIAAAEQAKYYAMPILHAPITLDAALKMYAHHMFIFFDCKDMVSALSTNFAGLNIILI